MALASLRALVFAGTAALVLASCSSGDDTTIQGRAGADKLVIAVGYDQPGLGVRRLDGVYKGFDVDVARYVAGELGADGVTFIEATPSQREELLTGGKADLVVSTYSITDKRKEQVAFAGPYFQTGQGLLVRFTDGEITGPESLNGKKLCSVSASTSAQKVKTEFARGVTLVEYGQYSDCVVGLLAGNVDAVTTDQVILAGYVAENPELLKLVGQPFTTEKYGVGLPKADARGRADVSQAIEKMVSSGEWRRALERNIGQSGVELPDPPQVTEK